MRGHLTPNREFLHCFVQFLIENCWKKNVPKGGLEFFSEATTFFCMFKTFWKNHSKGLFASFINFTLTMTSNNSAQPKSKQSVVRSRCSWAQAGRVHLLAFLLFLLPHITPRVSLCPSPQFVLHQSSWHTNYPKLPLFHNTSHTGITLMPHQPALLSYFIEEPYHEFYIFSYSPHQIIEIHWRS